MTDARVDFAGCNPVNHLWPQLVERLGSAKAQQAVRQALDVQAIHGSSGTLPVLVVETCGSALASTALIREQIGLNAHGERMVLLFSTREKLVQLLQQAI